MPTFWESVRALIGTPTATPIEKSLLEKLARTFPHPLFIVNTEENRFLWVSPGTLTLTGLSLEVLLSQPAKEFLEKHLSPFDPIAALWNQQAAEGEVEVAYRHDPDIRYLQGYWIELQKGVYALTFQDITGLRLAQEELTQYAEELRQQVDTLTELKNSLEKANQELAESRERMRLLAAVAAHTDNAVIITDAEGRAIWVNRGFEKLTGYTLEEVKGKVPGKLLQGPETDPATVARIRESLKRKEPFTEEILNYTKEGRPYWLRLYITPLTDDFNQVTHFMAIELDITAEKEQMQKLEAQLRDVQQAQSYASRIYRRFLPDVESLRPYFSDVEL